jgi:hypothetical protein
MFGHGRPHFGDCRPLDGSHQRSGYSVGSAKVSSHVGFYRKPKTRSGLGSRQTPSDRLRLAKRNAHGDFTGSTIGERPNGSRFCSQTVCLVLAMTTAIYFGELVSAISLAITLLAASTLKFSIAAPLFCCGLAAWTLAEYIAHRFVLHAIAPVQHGIHHARPQDAIDKVFWQIWFAFALAYLTVGGAFLAGVLVAYGWFLSVHYCAHHSPAILPASILKHHLDHHRFANRNYGVTTKSWDRLFGTLLR